MAIRASTVHPDRQPTMLRSHALLLLLPLLLLAACGSHQDASPAPDAAASPAATPASPAATPASPAATPASPAATPAPGSPEAKIQISYSHQGDFLASVAVTKYSTAQTLATYTTKDGAASVIRFDGGVTVWQFGVEERMLAGMPVIGREERSHSAPKEVSYGTLPGDFTQSIPDNGPPEPLETNHYYVFAVTRGSGSVSYEAVKVNGDGSLEAYEADPRAGTSFRLCCDLSADFTIVPPPQ
jgi:hypothetical protein